MGEPGTAQQTAGALVSVDDAEGPGPAAGTSQALDDDAEPGGIADLALGKVEEEVVTAVIDDSVQHHAQVRDGMEVETPPQGDMMTSAVATLVERHDRVSTVIHGRLLRLAPLNARNHRTRACCG